MGDFKIKKVVVDVLPEGCWECPLFCSADDHVCGCRPKLPNGCLLLSVNLDDERYEDERHGECPLALEE